MKIEGFREREGIEHEQRRKGLQAHEAHEAHGLQALTPQQHIDFPRITP